MTVDVQFYIAKNNIKIVNVEGHKFTVLIGKAFEQRQVGFAVQWRTPATKLETYPEERKHPETLRNQVAAIVADPVKYYQEQVDHVIFVTHSETVLAIALQALASGKDVKVYEIDQDYKINREPDYKNFFSTTG